MWVFVAAIIVVLFAVKSFLSKKKTVEAVETQSAQSPEASGADGEDKKEKPRISFYFGSQTGTAEGFAAELAENGDEDAFDIRVVDLEDVDPEEDLPGDAVSIFVVATYGEGDPTDNAVDFFSWLGSATEFPEGAENLKFAVFGLGDTQYENYNSMGRAFQKRLEELGGECVYVVVAGWAFRLHIRWSGDAVLLIDAFAMFGAGTPTERATTRKTWKTTSKSGVKDFGLRLVPALVW